MENECKVFVRNLLNHDLVRLSADKNVFKPDGCGEKMKTGRLGLRASGLCPTYSLQAIAIFADSSLSSVHLNYSLFCPSPVNRLLC